MLTIGELGREITSEEFVAILQYSSKCLTLKELEWIPKHGDKTRYCVLQRLIITTPFSYWRDFVNEAGSRDFSTIGCIVNYAKEFMQNPLALVVLGKKSGSP